MGRCAGVHPSPAWYFLGWCRAWEPQLCLGLLLTHPLLPAHQVPSCSPTSSCSCSAASPSSSWNSPLGSLPARAALASGGSAPCSKVRSCLSVLAQASMAHLLSQCLAAGVTLTHHGVHAHLWHTTWPGAGTCSLCSPAHGSWSALHWSPVHMPTPATLPCTACLASLARITRAPVHTHRISCANPHPVLASTAGITHTSLHMTHVSLAHHSCRGHSGPLSTLWHVQLWACFCSCLPGP